MDSKMIEFTYADKIYDKAAILIFVNYLAMLSRCFTTN